MQQLHYNMSLSMMTKICIGNYVILERRRRRNLRLSQKTGNRAIQLPSTSTVVLVVVVVVVVVVVAILLVLVLVVVVK